MRLLSFLVLSFALLQAACGFQPIYGSHDNGTPVAAELNQVAIDNIADRPGQILRNDLIDRMYGKGRPVAPRYRLEAKVRVTEEQIGILLNATSTRTEFNLYADYTLRDMNGKDLAHGTTHSVTSFNTLSSQYGTVAAREDAYQRTLHEVSEQIVDRLSLYFSEQAPASAPPKPPLPTAPQPVP